MKKYIYIGVGGMLGAMSRFGIKNIEVWNYHGSYPINTLLVNITGSFLLLLVLTIAFEVLDFDADIRTGASTGFLGAYTTFSTLCKETVGFLVNGDYFLAISYIIASTVLGLAFAYLGVVLARKIIEKLIGEEPEACLNDETHKSEVG